jgi:hypothetical protein
MTTTANIVTLSGAPLTQTRIRPNARLARCEEQSNAELLAPLTDCLFQLGGNAMKLLCLLGGDKAEALRLIEAELEARFEVSCGND